MKSMIKSRYAIFSAKYRILAYGYFLNVWKKNQKSASFHYLLGIVTFVNCSSFIHLFPSQRPGFKINNCKSRNLTRNL